MTRVDIPGVGIVEFPPEMSPADIQAAIERDILKSAPEPEPAALPAGLLTTGTVPEGAELSAMDLPGMGEPPPAPVPATGSVMDGYTPAPKIEGMGAPVSDEVFNQVKATWEAATPEARRNMEALPGWRGSVAKTIAQQYAGMTSATEPFDQRFEALRAREIRAGAAPEVADNMARTRADGGSVTESPESLADKLGRMTVEKTGSSTAGDIVTGAVDLAGSVAKVAPTTGKMILDVASMAPLIGQTAEAYSEELATVIEDLGNMQSGELQGKALQLAETVRNGSAAQVTQLVLSNPDLLADVAIPSAASMYLIGGTGAVTGAMRATQFAGKVSPRALARIQQRAAADGAMWANIAVNAGGAYAETQGPDTARYTAAIIAALGTKVAGKLTDGGAERVIATGRTGLAGNPVAVTAGVAGREMGQEFIEGASQGLGTQTGEVITGQREGFTPGEIVNQGVLEGIAAAGPGAAVGAASVMPAAPAPQGDLTTGLQFDPGQIDAAARQSLSPYNAQLTTTDPLTAAFQRGQTLRTELENVATVAAGGSVAGSPLGAGGLGPLPGGQEQLGGAGGAAGAAVPGGNPDLAVGGAQPLGADTLTGDPIDAEILALEQRQAEPVDLEDARQIVARANERGDATNVRTFTAETLPDELVADTGTSRRAVSLVGAIATVTGRKVVYFDSPNSYGQGDAFVTAERPDTIFIRAGGNHDAALAATFGHEFEHGLSKDQKARLWKVFETTAGGVQNVDTSDTAMLSHFNDYTGGRYKKQLAALKKMGRTDADILTAGLRLYAIDKAGGQLDPAHEAEIIDVTRGLMRDEFAADIYGNRVREPETWRKVFQELKRTDVGTLRKIANTLRQIVASLRKAQGGAFKTDAFVRNVEAIRDIAAEILAENAPAAVESTQRSGQRIGPFPNSKIAQSSLSYYANRGIQYDLTQVGEEYFLERQDVGQEGSDAPREGGLGRGRGVSPDADVRADGRDPARSVPGDGTAAVVRGSERSAPADAGGVRRGAGVADRPAAPDRAGERGAQRAAPSAALPGAVQRGTGKAGEVALVGIHFSKAPRPALNGGYFGTGIKSQEAERVAASKDPRIKVRVYMYVNEGRGVRPEQDVGTFAHAVRARNLYDWAADPQRIVSRFRHDANAIESAILDAGFDGYYSKGAFGDQGVAIILGDAARSVPTERPDQPNGVTERSTATTPYSEAKARIAPLMQMRDLPGGQVEANRWGDMIMARDEDLYRVLDEAGVFEGDEKLYRDELAGRYLRGVQRTERRTADKENITSVVVGGKPGQFGWAPNARMAAEAAMNDMLTLDMLPKPAKKGKAAANPLAINPAKLGSVPIAPFVAPTQYAPNLIAVGDAVRRVLSGKAARDVVADVTGARIQGVSQIHGSWMGKAEPSFVLSGEMTYEQSVDVAKLFGVVFAQDAVVTSQPRFEDTPDQIPAVRIQQRKVMSEDQLRKLHDAASAAGMDYSTTVDGRGAKFLYFGDADGYADFYAAVDQIRDAAGLTEASGIYVRSELHEHNGYVTGRIREVLQGSRDSVEPGAGGRPDLFRRAVDHLLVPYAKAVGAEGYRLSADRFAERFGLDPDQTEYLRAALRPRNGKLVSTVPIVTGEEQLDPPRTNTKTKKPGVSKNDLLWALQNRAAQAGQIDPLDTSPEAMKIISDAMVDEVVYMLGTESGKNAVGWYDASLKRAKLKYEEVFPELRSDPDREMLFDALLGIASQGNDVHANATFAGRMYYLITRRGMSINAAAEALTGTFGKQTAAIEKNYEKLDHLLTVNGFDGARKFFNTRATIGELNAILRTDENLYGPDGEPLSIKGEAAQTVTGWSVFGPKIGSFINNLHGDYSTLTADLWFSRTWNRYLGNVFGYSPDLESAQYVKLYWAVQEEARTKIGRDATDMSLFEVEELFGDPDAVVAFAEEVHARREKEYKTDKSDAVTPLRQAAKALIENRQDAQEIPRRDSERGFQQRTVEAAQRKIRRKTGINISVADIQAVLWYYEKDMFKSFGVGDAKAESADYADAAAKFVTRYNDGDLFYVDKPKPRYVIGKKGDYLGVQRSQRRETEALASAFLAASRFDGAFKMPVSAESELPALVAELIPSASVRDVTAMYSPPAGRKLWRVSLGGSDAFVTLDPNRGSTWINVAGQGEGKGGWRIYAAVGNWAANNGYSFVGDPDGLSDAGKRRRLENLISLKLKFPQLDARLAQSQIEWLDDRFGVKMNLREDDSLHNLGELIRASYEVNRQLHPEIENAEFQPDGTFRDRRTGGAFDFARLTESIRAPGNIGARGTVGAPGSATLRRAALAKSVVETTDADGRSEVVEALYALRDQSLAAPGDLTGVLYSGRRAGTFSEEDAIATGDAVIEDWSRELPRDATKFDRARAIAEIRRAQRDSTLTPEEKYRVAANWGTRWINMGGTMRSRAMSKSPRLSEFSDNVAEVVPFQRRTPAQVAEEVRAAPDGAEVRVGTYVLTPYQDVRFPGVDITENGVDAGRLTFDNLEAGIAELMGVQRTGRRITVDGVDRPAENSEGRPIHPTEEGIRNFWRWFGDSKVVDGQGRPLVMYHGTSTDVDFNKFKVGKRGAWFTSNQEVASEYATDNDSQGHKYNPDTRRFEAVNTSSRVMPAYLKIESPYRLTNADRQRVNVANYAKAQRDLFAELDGFDGILWNDALSKEWVVLDAATQVKSATGNNGDFDPTDPRITRTGRRFATPQLPEGRAARALDKVVYALQDRLTDLKAIQDAIVESGGVIRDQFNPYQAETLMHGTAAYKTQQFFEDEIRPVLNRMRMHKVSIEELDKYLHARHAKERNAAMAAINPNAAELDQLRQDAELDVNNATVALAQDPNSWPLQQALQNAQARLMHLTNAKPWSGSEEDRLSLSGMTDAEADQILAAAAPHMAQLGDMIDAVTARTRQELLAYGLESLDTVQAMEAAYNHYVPLQRDMEESDLLDSMGGTGGGFSVRGSSVKRATGSRREVEHIFANLVAAREQTIVRGEKNRVGKALYGLVMEHPNDELYAVVRPGMSKKALRAELAAMGLAPDLIDEMVKAPVKAVINERTGLVEMRVNPTYAMLDNAVVVRVAGQDRVILFNKGNDRAVRLMRALRNDDAEMGVSRWVMEWIGPVTRYLASINTQYNPIFGLTNFARDIQGAMLNLTTTDLNGRQAAVAKTVPSALRGIWNWERGDKTHPWAAIYEDFLAAGGATGYRDQYASMESRAKAIERELAGTGPRNWVGAKQVLDWLSDYNTAIENSIRLATYKQALDAGLSRPKAAAMAKDVTVNFNRKGARSGALASLYAFFNSAVQGTERTLRVIRKNPKAFILGGVGLGALNTMMMMLSLGDDWDEIPEFERAKHLFFPAPWNESGYIKIPMPLGFHTLPNIGRSLVEMAVYRDKLGERALGMVATTIDGFNPLGSGGLLAMAMPSIADPFVELASNKNSFGREIYREDFSAKDPTPGFTRARQGTASVWVEAARGINAATGGDDYEPGLWSPTAEELSYAFGVAGGGLLREAEKIWASGEAAATGESLPAHRVPILGRFYGEARGDSAVRSAFSDAIRKVNIAENQMRGRAEDGKEWRAYAPLGGLAKWGRKYESSIADLSKAKAQTNDPVKRKELEARILELQQQFVQLVRDAKP